MELGYNMSREPTPLHPPKEYDTMTDKLHEKIRGKIKSTETPSDVAYVLSDALERILYLERRLEEVKQK